MMNLFLYINTLRYLKVTQLWHQGVRKISSFRHRPGESVSHLPENLADCHAFLLPWITKPTTWLGEKSYSFLNIVYNPTTWDDNTQGDLWRYNLNYMDYLLQDGVTTDKGLAMMQSFMQTASQNRISDDPYPISLRGINWIKFFALHTDVSAQKKKSIDAFLLAQYRWLATHTEQHLMANHYLENGFSLLFGAVYFQDKALLKIASRLLPTQLKEQILSDGAHFELSPMYHCVLLDRLLDCYNLILSNGGVSEMLKNCLADSATAMLGWLEAIVLSDGTIPLLNDAAYEVAPTVSQLFDYAHRLGLSWTKSPLSSSGYRHFTGGRMEMIADIGPIGASYNPGHAHADTFNFVVQLDGKPFIVDTGTSTYAAGKRRDYERSSMAHNTVVVNGKNSSCVWGAFRCAERARVTILTDDTSIVEASHDGFASEGVTIRRRWDYQGNSITVTDWCEGNEPNEVAAYIHLAPDVQVLSLDSSDPSAYVLRTDCGTLSFKNALNVEILQQSTSSEYNRLLATNVLKVTFSQCLETAIFSD